jgi:hypothetical protein
MNFFPYIFYLAAAFAAIAASMAIYIHARTDKHAAIAALICPLILVYLIGMYRVGGVDFDNYAGYLGSDRDSIPDIGYKLLMGLVSAAGMQLSEFFLLQGLFTLGAVYLLARKFGSDFVVTICLYILHAAIVRDFTQSRAGLAIAIYFVALAQERKALYLALTAAAVSVHMTLIPLVLVYHWARMVVGFRKGQVLLVAGPAVALVVSTTVLLPMLASLDPRIEVYINWSQDLYGDPVGSYTTLLLFLLLAAICYRTQRITGDEQLRVFLIMMVYAAVTFVAFRTWAIFSYRLSNVVAALYPFAVGRAISVLKERDGDRLHGVAVALLGALLLAIVIRPGSLDALQQTQPALLAN